VTKEEGSAKPYATDRRVRYKGITSTCMELSDPSNITQMRNYTKKCTHAKPCASAFRAKVMTS